MLADLNMLAQKLETDRGIKVVVFQSANPEIFVAHADTNFLKDMSAIAVSHVTRSSYSTYRVVLGAHQQAAPGHHRQD